MKSTCRLYMALVTASLLVSGPVALSATVCERWCAEQPKAAHAGTLAVTEANGFVCLRFDLSALPGQATIHDARLHLVGNGEQPQEPIEVFVATRVQRREVRHDGKRLSLEPPWYRRFVAGDAVRRSAGGGHTELTFAVAPFDGFRAGQSCLDICYEGTAKTLPPQVYGLRAVHHGGQTFLIWGEHPAYRPEGSEVIWVRRFSEKGDVLAKGPGDGEYGMPNHPGITLRTLRRLQGLALRDKPSGFQGIKALQRAGKIEPVEYRVYRSTEKIAAANIHRAELLATVEPLSGYDAEVYKIHFKGEYLNQREEPESVIPTYCFDKGQALRPGEVLYVHTPTRSGKAYYAVTSVLAGTENLSQIATANSLATPVDERPGKPLPILQWVQEDRYKTDPTEYWYRYWAAPPYTNLPSRSFRLATAVSENLPRPAPLSISSISGAFNVRESIRVPRPDRVTFTMERQLAWLPALFYNEGRDTLRAKSECKVDYFCERYMELLINWITDKYEIDRARIEGSLLYFGLRHPEIFRKMSFGSYTATYDYRWAPGSPAHLGPRGIKTVDGEDAWEMYSVGGYVLKYPGRDVPFLVCISGTGKDRGHTSEFGWQDDPRGWAALLEARQPFVAAWSGQRFSRQFGEMLEGRAWDRTIPAFSNCSLDNNPGNGDPADGDYYGQINGYLLWGEDSVDKPGRWEMTLQVTDNCPVDACTVDVTPRHCRSFRTPGGTRLNWINTPPGSNRPLQSGTVTADRHGLVTIEGLKVTKAGNRLAIWR